MDLQNDPRVYFAAERTLLAWLRTGLAVIGLGFVVARFGLFLRLVAGEHPEAALHLGSEWVGVSLVIVGSLSIALGAWKHLRFCRSLHTFERPPNYWTSSSVWLSAILAFLGGILAAYVATTPLDTAAIRHSATQTVD
jgi:putative membrane protein